MACQFQISAHISFWVWSSQVSHLIPLCGSEILMLSIRGIHNM